MYRYRREDILRILQISPRQLAGWEKAKLVAAAGDYTFFDLLQIKKVRDLCARKVKPATIRQSLEAMQKQVAGMSNPLLEAGAFHSGKRVAFRHQGVLVEPIAGQFMFDFHDRQVLSSASSSRSATPIEQSNAVAELFARGIALEESPENQLQAIATYQRLLELDNSHAAAHINLGTIHYNRQEFSLAERHYRAAIASDPRYALAHFDLANVLDETGRIDEAIQTYHTALQLAPTYADAHYNLALAYEKVKQPRTALKHWRAYVKLDTSGPWSAHARSRIQKILQAEGLKLIQGGKQ